MTGVKAGINGNVLSASGLLQMCMTPCTTVRIFFGSVRDATARQYPANNPMWVLCENNPV